MGINKEIHYTNMHKQTKFDNGLICGGDTNTSFTEADAHKSSSCNFYCNKCYYYYY